MIVIEGPDAGGKSYTGAWLSSQLKIPLHHAGGPPKFRKEAINRIDQMFLNPNMFLEPNKIFDRCVIISEPIYGKIIRKDCYFSDQEIEDYLGILKKQAKIIYCRPSVKTILNHKLITKPHKSQEQVDAVEKSIKEIIIAYDKFMKEKVINYFLFNRDTMELKELLKFLKG